MANVAQLLATRLTTLLQVDGIVRSSRFKQVNKYQPFGSRKTARGNAPFDGSLQKKTLPRLQHIGQQRNVCPKGKQYEIFISRAVGGRDQV